MRISLVIDDAVEMWSDGYGCETAAEIQALARNVLEMQRIYAHRHYLDAEVEAVIGTGRCRVDCDDPNQERHILQDIETLGTGHFDWWGGCEGICAADFDAVKALEVITGK